MVAVLPAPSFPTILPLPDSVWRGDQLGSYRSISTATGYPNLDKELPGGGWPPSALVELLLPHPGIGELRLLAPTLGALTQSGKTVILLMPPHIPFAGALNDLGIRLKHVILIEAKKPADRVWAVEQALKSASFGALLCWLPQVRTDHMRRLQLAAVAGEGLSFVFRPWSAQNQSSPAPLRLVCQSAPAGQMSIEIIKRRGPVHAAPLILPLPLPRTLIKPLAAHARALSPFEMPPHVVDRTSSAAIAARRRAALTV